MASQKTVMAADGEDAKVRFLLRGSYEILPASYLKLRSYLNTHVSNLADQHNFKNLKNFQKKDKSCLYCYSSWSGDTTSFKLFPSKKSKFSQVQSNEVEKVKKKAIQINKLRNTLVLKCKVCSKRTSFPLIKKQAAEPTRKEIVRSCKKKKKKDKSCGLVVNTKRKESAFLKSIIHPKKKRIDNLAETKSAHPVYNSPISHLQLMKNKVNPSSDSSKNFMINPYATQIEKKFFRKKNKKIQKLKKALKDEKNLTSKTLKDFLTLI